MPSSSRPLLVTIPEAARLLGVGRTTVYVLLGTGRLIGTSIGRRRLVTMASIEALACCPSALGRTPQDGMTPHG